DALGDECSVGIAGRPLDQPIGQPLGVRRERLARDDQRRAVGAANEVGLERAAERQRAIARRRHGAFLTLAARPSRKARTRLLAASSPEAIASISDSTNRPSPCAMSAMRGSACMTAKFESGALEAIRSASANACRGPCP